MITDYQQVVPTEHRCIKYLAWLQEAYAVDITFWVAVRLAGAIHSPIFLRTSALGPSAYPLGPHGAFAEAPILRADQGSIYPALWACLTLVEHQLATVSRATMDRPPM